MRVVRFAVVGAVLGCGCSSPKEMPDASPGVDAAPSGTAQLVAMWPPLARTGQTVQLEGTFSGQPTIALPGGATAIASVLGDHRATIVVPANATVGNATGTTAGPVFFHAVTYQPGLRPFMPYEQADAAHAEPRPAESLVAPGAVALGNAIYVIGGYIVGSAFVTHVEAAAIHADGTLGDFAILPDVSLVTGRNDFATVTINAYVYVIGGSDGGDLATIERAPIGADGRLGTFEVLPSQLNAGRVGAAAAVAGDYLYVMGGAGAVTSVERARIEPDGTLDPFELMTLPLAEGRADANAIVSGNQLYVYGGATPWQGGLQPTPDVEAATIGSDGTIGPFALVPGVSLVVGRFGFASAVIGDGLYVFGGNGGGQSAGLVERAPIQADGTLGTFTQTAAYIGSSGVAVAIAGNNAYVIGGPSYQAVSHATMDASDVIGTSTETTSVLDTAVSSSGLVASGNAVYLLGGSTGAGFTADVQAGAITDGIVGTFTTDAGSHLVTARADAGTLTVGSNVYVIGGDTAGGRVGSIERATIGADGTLGPFAIDPDSALVTPRSQFATAVIDRAAGSFVLVLGGLAGDGSALDTIEQAPIQLDGSLGPFSLVGHTATPRRGCASFVTVGDIFEEVFLIGGRGATGELGDIERGSVDRTISNAFDTVTVPNTALTTPRAGHTAVVLGDHVYVVGGKDGNGPLDSVELATFTNDLANPLTPFAPVAGVTLAEPRRDARCSTIANQVYCFGGVGGSGALSSVEAAALQ